MNEFLFGLGIGLIVGVIGSIFLRSYDGYKAGYADMKEIALREFEAVQAKYDEKCQDMEKLKAASKVVLKEAEIDREKFDRASTIFMEYIAGNMHDRGDA